MDLSATLGYGIQVRAYEEPAIVDMDMVEDVYWNNKMLQIEYGSFEGSEAYLLYTPSIISASDYSAVHYNKLPKLDTIADEVLRETCEKLGITQDFRWWLIPYCG